MNMHTFSKSILFSFILVSVVFTGCTDENETNKKNQKTEEAVTSKIHTPETLLKEIEDLEAAVANLDTPNHDAVAKQLIEYYQSYAEMFPNNQLAPEMLFKAGNQAVNLQEYDLALTKYFFVEQYYLNYLKRPECLFLQAFVYETYKNEYGKAQEKYELLIEEYPKHELSEQAKISLKYLGMTDEERIKQFEKNI